MTTVFTIHGPLEVPFYQGKAARTITDDNVRTFWDKHPDQAQQRGCYVFGIKCPGGYTPGYVGKSAKAFKQEVFAPHKLARYQQFLADYVKAAPVVFLVSLPARRGQPNKRHIRELEQFLISLAVAANPDLLNVKGTRGEEWGLQGFLRGGRGKPSKSALEFRKLMKVPPSPGGSAQRVLGGKSTRARKRQRRVMPEETSGEAPAG